MIIPVIDTTPEEVRPFAFISADQVVSTANGPALIMVWAAEEESVLRAGYASDRLSVNIWRV